MSSLSMKKILIPMTWYKRIFGQYEKNSAQEYGFSAAMLETKGEVHACYKYTDYERIA
jgi:hypothetical protein